MNASASTGTEKARAHHQYHHHHHPHRKLPEPSQAEQLRRFTVKRSDVVCSIGKWQKRCNELHRSAGTPKLPQAQVERIDCTVTHACGSRPEQNRTEQRSERHSVLEARRSQARGSRQKPPVVDDRPTFDPGPNRSILSARVSMRRLKRSTAHALAAMATVRPGIVVAWVIGVETKRLSLIS
ncbi:hypothetical protein SNK03_002195 [Fusarium graminearum]|uniref:Chromosome 1, complete genome n=1 Tax=Gibberella zeae (strain ATCC MYA-4620 / CBS 123657 / FGSC 9075 / NRRL 31084 / PH-1) TaxID=229533 RepID=I1S5A9_GIBZE|nr:hypothetical protein FGSG_12027 [Fusarium graminearum PH-1]CAG1975871.1 unnamed protein product [Fusarium graminearum]ESU07280.1 hypothetical protein FGSG_12027 [Fusarium graminearum PH-1]CAG2004326.1 unnamed protein product [Fusarium graminearum]CEF74119.1 unnamed protein product [Fusarium graminearum]CZS77386.1 unnamed protein product [Fusarium graminearum]|eukprot:XP_011317765.1 hypothetical protein FGSG_12027 [Fusarium graminearum PH-1]